MKDKIAFVVQRYGEEVNGGAEAECRMYAERLSRDFDVHVITSCAVDHLTWKNHYPSGESVINNVTVHRFPVSMERDLDQFGKISSELVQKSFRTDEEEKKWLLAQGPLSVGAISYLDEFSNDYKAVFFMTYLYYLTVEGLKVCHAPSILIPTAHDEWPIYFRMYRRVFERADGFLYNSPGEKRFTDRLFLETCGKPSVTVGAGVELPEKQLPDIRERFGLRSPFIVYCGRIEESKGCGELFHFFELYKKKYGDDLELVLTGKPAMPIPERSDIHSLGFVSEEEKYACMQEAEAFVLASHFESLSIVVLESMMMGTPVLVNGNCEVLRDHAIISRAGLYFTTEGEFCSALHWLRTHHTERETMGENGRKYVAERYNWKNIVLKIRALIRVVSEK